MSAPPSWTGPVRPIHRLRHEVDTLIASSDDVRSSFLQSSTLRVTLTSGTKLGDYEVKSMLGSGGMGEVYRARDSRLGRDVAIKVLPSFLSSDSDRLRRFEQEARAAAALNHPNILAVFQMGKYEGTPYLVSELLEGETLREQIKRGRLRRWADALAAFDQRTGIGVLGVRGRADTVEEVGQLIKRYGVEPVRWYGVWLSSTGSSSAERSSTRPTQSRFWQRQPSNSKRVDETPIGN